MRISSWTCDNMSQTDMNVEILLKNNFGFMMIVELSVRYDPCTLVEHLTNVFMNIILNGVGC